MKRALQSLFKHDAFGGILLVTVTLIAIVFANSPGASLYQAFLSIPVSVQFGSLAIDKALILWINDGLMAIFFFLVGLEIKREMAEGHLSSFDQIILPAIAAVAGIALPALFFVFFNQADEIAMKGWAIPSATDIAFALGVFALFGKRLPLPLKLFLLSVAIFDDIGAILIIALFYTSDLSMQALGVAAIGLGALFVLNRMDCQKRWIYIAITTVIWVAVLKSGVHATLAGFAAALFIPLSKHNGNDSMLVNMEHALHGWVTFLILPIFAFSNAGVSLVGLTLDDLMHPISIGIVAGLVVGKQIGIFGACIVAVKLGIAKLPKGTTWLQMYGVSLLCGIGFTMSLFIGTLAFAQYDAAYLQSVKIGVLAGSFISAILGAIVMTIANKQAINATKQSTNNDQAPLGV